MQELTRLAKIIYNNNPKVLPVVDFADQTSLEGRLFQLVKGNPALSDEEACFDLYGEKKVTPNYRMLKSRLRKKLLNSLLFTELSEHHFRLVRIYSAECLSLVQQANKLIVLSEPILADKLADQIISVAKKAELNDMLAKAYELKQASVLITQNRAKFDKNIELLQHYYLLEAKEREALIIYNKLKFEVNMNISNSRNQAAAYQDALVKMKELWDITGSSCIYDYYHMLHLGYYEIVGNYEGIIQGIEEAEDLLDKGSINKLWFNERFNNFIKVYAYLRLGELDKGLHYSHLYLSTFKEGSGNWFAFLENYLILALHKKDYGLALQLCLLALENGILDNLVPGVRERWGLFFKYIRLISPAATEADTITNYQRQFETSIISKDKEGLNFPLIVANYLEGLPKLDVEGFEQYAERFGKYSSKYLKGDMGARAKIFVKLLLLSTKEEGARLKQKSMPLLEKLKTTPPPRDPFAEVEIVPYEHLWDLVLELHQQRVKQ